MRGGEPLERARSAEVEGDEEAFVWCVISIVAAPEVVLKLSTVESAHARRRDAPRGFLDAVVGDAKKRAANDLAEELLSPGTIDNDLKSALEVCSSTTLCLRMRVLTLY